VFVEVRRSSDVVSVEMIIFWSPRPSRATLLSQSGVQALCFIDMSFRVPAGVFSSHRK